MKIVDRQTKKEYEMTYDKSVKFLYNNVLGRPTYIIKKKIGFKD